MKRRRGNASCKASWRDPPNPSTCNLLLENTYALPIQDRLHGQPVSILNIFFFEVLFTYIMTVNCKQQNLCINFQLTAFYTPIMIKN